MAKNVGGLEPKAPLLDPKEHLILGCHTYSGIRAEYWVDRRSPIYQLMRSVVTDVIGISSAAVEQTLGSAVSGYRPSLLFDPDEHELFSGDLLTELGAIDIYEIGEQKYLVTAKHAKNVNSSWKKLGGLEALTMIKGLNRCPNGETRTSVLSNLNRMAEASLSPEILRGLKPDLDQIPLRR